MSCSNAARPGTFVRERIHPIVKPTTTARTVATRRHEQRVAEDVRVAAEAGEVVEPVRLRRARLRIAHAQRGLDEIGDRIEDEDGGAAPDDQADEARARPPGPGPRDERHGAGLRAP